jgi:hypothetical protein
MACGTGAGLTDGPRDVEPKLWTCWPWTMRRTHVIISFPHTVRRLCLWGLRRGASWLWGFHDRRWTWSPLNDPIGHLTCVISSTAHDRVNSVNSLVRCACNVSARPLKQSAGSCKEVRHDKSMPNVRRARSLNSVRTHQIRPSLHGEVLRRTYSKGTE